ncbi:hypothetical protein ACFQJ8_03660 [Halocatena marina]|uniref:hypothetical protein n=1 Tax=Halocatena marina TaxID=2934937 RepID=UPI00360C657A
MKSDDDMDPIKQALIEVDQRQRGHLSQTKYENLRDDHHPSVSDILYKCGWNDIKEEAGLHIDPRSTRNKVTKRNAITAVKTVSQRMDCEMTLAKYDEHRDDNHPCGGRIAKKFGWSRTKEEADLERREYQSEISRETAIRAIQTVSQRVEGNLTIASYNEHRDEHHPSGHGISSKLGWNSMKEAAGLTLAAKRFGNLFCLIGLLVGSRPCC